MASETLRTSYSFAGKNESAQAAVNAYTRRYTWHIAAETRNAIDTIIRQSITEGIAPADAAEMIEGVVGMNARQASAALKYQKRLRKQGLKPKRVRQLVGSYKKRKIRERAWTIARTETMGAMNAGSLESYRQAKAQGHLTDEALKEWIITPDEKLCAICSTLAGEKVLVDAAFSSGDMMPPAHPRCRCTTAVTEPMPGEKPRRGEKTTKLRPSDPLNADGFDPTSFSSPGRLARNIAQRMGVTAAEAAFFNFNSSYADMVGAAGVYHPSFSPNARAGKPGISLSGRTTTKIRMHSMAKAEGLRQTARWDGVQTLTHELSHATSKVSTKVGAYIGRNITLEEGIVELRGRIFADRLLKTNWKTQNLGWAYKDQVAGIERVLASSGTTVESFFQMDAAQRMGVVREAGIKHVEAVATKLNPDLGKKIRGFLDNEGNRQPFNLPGQVTETYLDRAAFDVVMDRAASRRMSEPFSPVGLRRFLESLGVESDEFGAWLVENSE